LDGKCQAVNPNGFIGVPRALKVFSQISNHDIFCYGQANEITILNSTTLEVCIKKGEKKKRIEYYF
jgi:hypothetical protein